MWTRTLLLAVSAAILVSPWSRAPAQETENRSGADMTVMLARRTGLNAGAGVGSDTGRLSVDLGECHPVANEGEQLVLDCSEALVRVVARDKPEIAAPMLGAFVVRATRSASGELFSTNRCEILSLESLVAATAFNAARGLGFYFSGVTRTVYRDELVEVGRGVRMDGVPVIRHRFFAAAFCVADPDRVRPQERDFRYEFKPYLEYMKDSGRLLRLWEDRRSNYVLSLAGQTAFDRTGDLLR